MITEQQKLICRDQLAQLMLDFFSRTGQSVDVVRLMDQAHTVVFDGSPQALRDTIALLRNMALANRVLDHLDDAEQFERAHNSHGVSKIEQGPRG